MGKVRTKFGVSVHDCAVFRVSLEHLQDRRTRRTGETRNVACSYEITKN